MAFDSLDHGILFDQETHEATLRVFASYFGEVKSAEETVNTLNKFL